VSGHGFGHATRVSEVLRELRIREPEIPLTVVSRAPATLFRAALGDTFAYRPVTCDVGLVQRDALRIDLEGTGESLDAFGLGLLRSTAYSSETIPVL